MGKQSQPHEVATLRATYKSYCFLVRFLFFICKSIILTTRNVKQKVTLANPGQHNPIASGATLDCRVQRLAHGLPLKCHHFTYPLVDNNAYWILDSGNVFIDCFFRNPHLTCVAARRSGRGSGTKHCVSRSKR